MEQAERSEGDAPPEFVPADFEVPTRLQGERFLLEPLGPQHNDADLEAWSSSIGHIRATPGYAGRSWPPREAMSPDENRRDLVRHAADFSARRGFTYTVLDAASGDVIGCVYIYPSRRAGFDAAVSSWVTATRAELDRPLYELVSEWLAMSWPFSAPDYAPR